MADRVDQQPKAEGNTDTRDLIFWTIGMLLLVAWHVYDGFKRPNSSWVHHYKASLLLLLGALIWVLAWVRRPRRVVRWVAVFLPLLVVVAFGWAQLEEARHQAAQKELAAKRQAWQQAVQRQRELSDQASAQLHAAIVKHGEAFKIGIETGQKLEQADGKPAWRFTADAHRKLEEAKDEFNRAIERDKTERARLLQLESESWHYRSGAR